MKKVLSVRLLAGSLAGLLAVTTLSACNNKADFPKELPAKSQVSSHPALSADRAAAVVSEVNAKIAAADQNKNLALADPRIDGPAKEMRQAQYNLFQKNNDRGILEFAQKSKAIAVTSSVSWPRAILNITDVPTDQPSFVQILRQNTNQDGFKLWQWMQILPGKELPATNAPVKGSEIVPADNKEGLIASPVEAAKLWEAKALNPDSDSPLKLSEDQMSKTLRDENAKLHQSLENLGKFEANIKLEDEKPLAFRLPDGGALVAATYRYSLGINDLKLSSPVELSGEVATLIGSKGKVREQAHWEYLVTVLLEVPANTTAKTDSAGKDQKDGKGQDGKEGKNNANKDAETGGAPKDSINPVAATRVLVKAEAR